MTANEAPLPKCPASGSSAPPRVIAVPRAAPAVPPAQLPQCRPHSSGAALLGWQPSSSSDEEPRRNSLEGRFRRRSVQERDVAAHRVLVEKAKEVSKVANAVLWTFFLLMGEKGGDF